MRPACAFVRSGRRGCYDEALESLELTPREADVETTLLEEARRAPLSRPSVEDFARRIDPESATRAARAALDTASSHAALVLAFAIAASGGKIDPALARGLLPELDDLDLSGPLLSAAGCDPVEVVLAVFDDRSTMLEHEALLALLAAESLAGKPAPDGLLVHARYLARHDIDSEARICLGAAAVRLGDPNLLALTATFVASAKRNRKLVEEILAKARRSPLEALPEVSERLTGVGFTVRRAKDVGRNDPCPCGSGQKYKKCCANKPQTGAEPERLDPATLRPEQALGLKPSELARLDPKRVPSAALVDVARRAIGLRRFPLVLRVLEEAEAREDMRSAAEELRIFALSAALEARDEANATRLAEGLPEDVDVSIELALLRKEPGALERLEQAALDALRHEADGAKMIDLGHVTLRHLPALGVLVARGAVHEGRPRESAAMIQRIEDARDRLLLPPAEPWWDVLDALADAPDPAERAGDEASRELKGELRRARAESRKASSQVAQLKARLDEVDAQIAAGPRPRPEKRRAEEPAPAPRAPDAALEEERRRLRGKVEELQRIIGEGQEERRELRRKLEEMAEAGPKEGAARAEADGEGEESAYEAAEVDEPRRVLVPIFTDRAAKALVELSGAAADVVLTVVAALASSRENAWGGVKRLEKARTVYSARAGIHYRVLFTVDGGALTVHEVVHRRDLEQAVTRAVRIG